MPVIDESKPSEKRRALGRGLDSLLPSGPRIVAAATPAAVAATAPAAHLPEAAEPSARDRVSELPLDLIDDNPYQTRRRFDPAALEELAASIRVHGLAQPVVVRPAGNGRYVLVLGERRCRALKLAGKTMVPAIIRGLSNQQAAEMTIIENLQRQDLNSLEQARAFARLSRDFSLTQEQIGQRTGVSRESVANYMRLLKLPDSVLEFIGQGKIGFSEARILLEAGAYLDVPALEKLAEEAVQSEWTVKELQARLNQLKQFGPAKSEPLSPKAIDPNVRAAQSELERRLGMRVRISDHKGKGKIVIEYRNISDFDRILELLDRK